MMPISSAEQIADMSTTQLGSGPFVNFQQSFHGACSYLCSLLVFLQLCPLVDTFEGVLSPDGWWVSRWVQVVSTCSHLSQDLTVGVHLIPVVEVVIETCRDLHLI